MKQTVCGNIILLFYVRKGSMDGVNNRVLFLILDMCGKPVACALLTKFKWDLAGRVRTIGRSRSTDRTYYLTS